MIFLKIKVTHQTQFSVINVVVLDVRSVTTKDGLLQKPTQMEGAATERNVVSQSRLTKLPFTVQMNAPTRTHNNGGNDENQQISVIPT